MLQTEYKGSKYVALLAECRRLGLGGIFFRGRYELSKKLGLMERKYAAGRLTTEDFIRSLNLELSDLAEVRRTYNSHGADAAAMEFIEHLRSRKSPGFLFNWRRRRQYQAHLKELFGHQEPQLLGQADDICRNRINIFGSGCVDFGSDVDWHLEPSSGGRWPLVHWSRLDIRGSDRVGDARVTWEVNRHQFLFTLGRAYWFTGNEKYAGKFAEMMRRWLDANPPEMGINWYSNLEIAVRLISWLWAYNFFLDSPLFDNDLHLDFLKTVLQSCRHIVGDMQYSIRSMGNNHVIGDAAALALVGILFPEFREARNWRDTYISMLFRELERQVYNDGTDFEQSTNYHKFVLYFYVLILRIMQVNNLDIHSSALQKIEKMVEFMMHVMKPDGTMPQIGDSDDARLLNLSNDDPNAIAPILSTGAVMFQRGDFKYVAEDFSEETFWLCGSEGYNKFNSLTAEMPEKSKAFPDGGYCIMRSGWDRDSGYMLFKCGTQADHGHADALHIELYSNGKICLRDCGTYTYNGSWRWRTFFRSTQAHNTVVVDGESQSIPHRVFRWLKPAKSRLISSVFASDFNYLEAEHDGYSRYKSPVIHNRSVFFANFQYWILIDRLIGRGKHSVDLLFHTPTDDHEMRESTKVFHSSYLDIVPAEPGELQAAIMSGVKNLPRGWFSPYYGMKEPSTTVVYSYTGELPKTIVTILDPDEVVTDVQLCRQVESIIINVDLVDFRDKLVVGRENSDLSYLRTDRHDS